MERKQIDSEQRREVSISKMILLILLPALSLVLLSSGNLCRKTGHDNILIQDEWKSPNIKVILENTSKFEYGNGNRLPLYLWPAIDPGELTYNEAEQLVRELAGRGVGIIRSWKANDKEKSLAQSLIIARAQKKLNQRININATALLNSFFNGDERTAHIDENGKLFFDESYGRQKMGCAFAIDFRKFEIRERVEYFVQKFKEEGLPVDFIFTDWEIDGPIEVNHAFEASKKCVICRKNLGDNYDFLEFQKVMRNMRSYLHNYSYSTPVLSAFPNALVGNYAVYPNDGYRYWYDYFEFYADGQPYNSDQQAKYRKWYNDYPTTAFTYAMPVVYPWSRIYKWYDFDNPDYRWFYNMLLVATNAGKGTPQIIPIISFVHWNIVFKGTKQDSSIKQMSKDCYKEMLWHMLLRGTDTFFMWSGNKEFAEEVRLVHEVYSAAQKYGAYLENGLPINFDIPDKPGTVVSGLALGDSILIRRTDFGGNLEPVEIIAGTKLIKIEYRPGICTVLPLR